MAGKLVEGGSPYGVLLHDPSLVNPKPETGIRSDYPIVYEARFILSVENGHATLTERPLKSTPIQNQSSNSSK